MQNFEIARLFYEMATLLEVHDESRFRVRAYQRAAQTLEALSEDIEAVSARGDVQKLPAVGRDLASRIDEYLRTGRMEQLERLRGGLPPSFLGLLDIRGLGPRTAKLLHDRLGVDSVERLEAICRSKEILTVAGIREKTRENILKGIALWKAGRARAPLTRARALAAQLATALRAHGGVERLEIAGSIRRMCETVKDVDLLVTSTDPRRVIGTLCALPSVTEVIARGETRASVRHQDGLQVDLRVDILGHPTGRLIGSREPYDVDMEAVFAAARAHGKAIEINSSPDRLDLHETHARRAAELGIPLAISTDTHYLSELDHLELGIGVARRAWLGPSQILNTRSLADLLAWAAHR